jgi:hypothetical protein
MKFCIPGKLLANQRPSFVVLANENMLEGGRTIGPEVKRELHVVTREIGWLSIF